MSVHRPNVVIVGAGISGLALAYRLHQLRPDADLTILESDSRPGGKIWTERRDGFIVECGPNGFLETKPSTMRLCRDLGLGEELVAARDAARKHRYIFDAHRLRELPGGPLGVLTTRLVGWRSKLKLLTEPFRRSRRSGDESVAEFFRRRMGREAAETFGDALVTGIHGGDPELLSMRSAFPRVAQLEQEHGSVIRGFLAAARQRRRDARARGETPAVAGRMWSCRTGLRQLVESAIHHLPRQPIFGVGIRRIERREHDWLVYGGGRDSWPADVVVLCCPAYSQAEMLADLDSALAGEVAGIAYNRIAVVALGYRSDSMAGAPDGFGFIAPQRLRRDILGVQWCSAIYPGRAPDGCVLWRALCGGWHRPDVVDWEDSRLIEAVRAELRIAMRVEATPIFSHIVRWDRAIPQYHVGHQDRLDRIDALRARHPGLILGGNAYRGVALNDCTEQAEELAGAIAGTLKPLAQAGAKP